MEFNCSACQRNPVYHFVNIYLHPPVIDVKCTEVFHRNLDTFDYTDGCKDHWIDKNGIGGTKIFMGSVYITPHFHHGFSDLFTNKTAPGHESAGS